MGLLQMQEAYLRDRRKAECPVTDPTRPMLHHPTQLRYPLHLSAMQAQASVRIHPDDQWVVGILLAQWRRFDMLQYG